MNFEELEQLALNGDSNLGHPLILQDCFLCD